SDGSGGEGENHGSAARQRMGRMATAGAVGAGITQEDERGKLLGRRLPLTLESRRQRDRNHARRRRAEGVSHGASATGQFARRVEQTQRLSPDRRAKRRDGGIAQSQRQRMSRL